ncbi:hypothetical protein JOM56_009751 [Amanita muscaria]
MRRFSIFCVLLLQIILFAQPTVSESAKEETPGFHAFMNLNDILQREGMRFEVTQPTKQCSDIKYSLDSMPFLIVPCFDKSSKELDVTLKVGNVNLGQEKTTFDTEATEVSISFDHGQLLNGEHRYYLKDNYLWLHYDNIIFGRKHTGDQRLNPMPSGFISSEDASKPKPKKDASKSKPKRDASKPSPKKGASKPNPKKDASKSKSRYDI